VQLPIIFEQIILDAIATRKKKYEESGEEPNPLTFLMDACKAYYWSKKMEWHCSIF
jgi:hypothetical protein